MFNSQTFPARLSVSLSLEKRVLNLIADSNFNVEVKTLLCEGLSEPAFYGDSVYKFKNLRRERFFVSAQKKIITRYRRIEYNLNSMRQSVCLVFTPNMVDNYAAFFNARRRVGRQTL